MPLVPMIDGYETVAEMEKSLDLDEGTLQETLDRYNEHAARGEDPDFHKAADWLAAAGPVARGRPSTYGSATRCTPASPSAASG